MQLRGTPSERHASEDAQHEQLQLPSRLWLLGRSSNNLLLEQLLGACNPAIGQCRLLPMILWQLQRLLLAHVHKEEVAVLHTCWDVH